MFKNQKNNKKLTLTALLVFSLMLITGGTVFAADNGGDISLPIVFGDVNNDGEVTVADAILILRHIGELTNLNDIEKYDEYALFRANVAGQRFYAGDDITFKPSLTEAILVLRKIVGLIEYFEVDYAIVEIETIEDITVPLRTEFDDLINNILPAEIQVKLNNGEEKAFEVKEWQLRGQPFNEGDYDGEIPGNYYRLRWHNPDSTTDQGIRIYTDLLNMLGLSREIGVTVDDFKITAASTTAGETVYDGNVWNNNVTIDLSAAEDDDYITAGCLCVNLPGTLDITNVTLSDEAEWKNDIDALIADPELDVYMILQSGKNTAIVNELIEAIGEEDVGEEGVSIAYARTLLGDEIFIEGTVTYLLGDGSDATTNVSMTINLPSAPVDKSALETLIQETQTFYDDAEKGDEPGQYPWSAANDFQAAINTAQAMFDDENATQNDVDTAVTELNTAYNTFKDSVNEALYTITFKIENDKQDPVYNPWIILELDGAKIYEGDPTDDEFDWTRRYDEKFYEFSGLSPGSYDYSISIQDHDGVSGTLDVVDGDVNEDVVMNYSGGGNGDGFILAFYLYDETLPEEGGKENNKIVWDGTGDSAAFTIVDAGTFTAGYEEGDGPHEFVTDGPLYYMSTLDIYMFTEVPASVYEYEVELDGYNKASNSFGFDEEGNVTDSGNPDSWFDDTMPFGDGVFIIWVPMTPSVI